jgi:hypothetical protein
MSLFNQLASYWRLGWGLRGFLREPVTLEQSREIIRQGLQNREQNLLAMVKKAIYANAASPYLKLLDLAGCEYGDLEKMVRLDGIEPALRKLREAGVYITIEEFKGKKEAVRSGKVFSFRESDFDNPFMAGSLKVSSSASRGAGTRVMMILDRYYYYAAHDMVVSSAHAILGSPVLLWMPILPSMAGLPTMLRLIKMGNPPLRWFSPVTAGTIKPSLTKRLATAYAVYASRLFGADFARPEYVSLEQADKVAGCMVDLLKQGQGCVLWTIPNWAVRVCQAAREGHMDLAGATFAVAGEPLTEVKVKEIRAVGAKAINMFAAAETGVVGFSCAGQTAASDDIHLLKDLLAVIQHRRGTHFGGAPVDAFLFTTLFSKVPKILLNTESGDYGLLESKQCECGVGELGLTDHLSNIRSFDKLTGEGMSFVGVDLLRIIEEVLPTKFGGASIDYQMVEEEDGRGYTRLTLLVSPEVGEVDEAELIRTVLAELSKGHDTQRMMAEIWSQAGTLRIKRARPFITDAGKLLPLHIQKIGTKEGGAKG